jgi:RNA polymerase sigma factor (sigma-70 family)
VKHFPNDIALLSAFHHGEAVAEKIIFDNYFHPLCITGDILQSEDIVAEAFEKLMSRRANFSCMPKLKSFLYQTVHNAAINYVIAKKRHKMAYDQIRHLTKNDQEDCETVQNEILRVELIHEIYTAMGELPDKCGQIFKMIFVEELSNYEIAGRLQINVQTVRTQKARAIGLIRNALLHKDQRLALISSLVLLCEILPLE